MLTDQDYLRNKQYRDASNLDARAQLHVHYSVNRYGWHRWVFDQLDIPEAAQVLELGCGPAWLWQENMQRVAGGWQVILSDLSPGMLKTARENLGPASAQFRFEVADAQRIPFNDNCFDAVIANHMLYHVPNREEAFIEIRRVLKPGGQLYAATNGKAHLAEMHELFQQSGFQSAFGPERTFSLENGEQELVHQFSDVRLLSYPDALVVTDAAPLIAYARSVLLPRGQEEALAEFSRLVSARIATNGSIHIAKDSGLLVGRKAE